MDGFKPNVDYVREMKRYGILPETLDVAQTPVDVYQIDDRYFRSHWHYAPGNEPKLYENATLKAGLIHPPPSADELSRPKAIKKAQKSGIRARGFFNKYVSMLAAFDGNKKTKWADRAGITWISYQYPENEKVTVHSYAITSANNRPERDPRDWKLEGSNDGGKCWSVIDTQQEQIFSERFQTKSYPIARPAAFNRYRLNITASKQPWGRTQLSELMLNTEEPTPAVCGSEPKEVAVDAPVMKPMLFANEKEVVEFDARGRVVWRVSSGVARDVWRLENGHVLFPFNQNGSCGVREVNKAGNIVWEYKLPGKFVISCQRLENGNTLVGASCKKAVLVVNPAGEIVHEIKVRGKGKKHSTTIVRQVPNGNILVVEEDIGYVTEYTLDGQVAWEFKPPFRPFGAERLENGNVLISGQNGIIEVNRKEKIVWQLTKEDVSEMGPRWFAGFDVLDNGNIVVCNAGGKVQFFEVNRDKQVVWRTALNTEEVGFGHGIWLINR